MCRCDFRVKVDLSKFYDDVRRSSWVYVDKGEITCICHLQKHITKVFDIQRPFHLLLNTGEYLPPNEDSRILKEDETILVVPGTGLQKNYTNPVKTPSDSQANTSRPVTQPTQCVTESNLSAKIKVDESSEDEDEVANSLETTTENTIFLSMINDSRIESESKPDVSSMGESPVPDTSILKNKRKRVRRKRSKNTTLPEEPVANGGIEAEYKKPKILNSVTIPNGKHIRFGDVEKMEFQGYDSSASNESKKQDSRSRATNGREDSYWDKPVAGSNLANLLALRQSSTPITFGRKKTEEATSQGNADAKETRENGIEERLVAKKESQGLTVDPKKHPLMENKARVNDVIAFKMLKMGSDYTPQISEYIIAQSMQILPDRTTYMFKILEGKGEVQAPQGKFDIETDETQDADNDVIALNWSQLIEPRLIYRE